MPDRTDGSEVEELSNLVPFVEETSTDFKKWETTFKCRDCGQKWLERYESHGHASVPIVEKVSEFLCGKDYLNSLIRVGKPSHIAGLLDFELVCSKNKLQHLDARRLLLALDSTGRCNITKFCVSRRTVPGQPFTANGGGVQFFVPNTSVMVQVSRP